MKRAIFIIAALALLTIRSSFAHPTDTAATYVGSAQWETALSAATNVKVEYVLIFWLTSAGNYDYVIDVSSLTFSGTTCSEINSIPLSSIVEDIADHAVAKSVSEGYPACAFMSFSMPVKVWVNSCASRANSGCNTVFLPCNAAEWSYHQYAIDCPGTGAAATITRGSPYGGPCFGGCEGTCLP